MSFELRLAMLVGAGGFIGAVLRYFVSSGLNGTDFPYGTLAVNILGAFLLGVIMFAALANIHISDEWRYFAGIGILGAFTTMSAFSHEVWELAGSDTMRAGIYVGLTVGACIGAIWAARVFNASVLARVI